MVGLILQDIAYSTRVPGGVDCSSAMIQLPLSLSLSLSPIHLTEYVVSKENFTNAPFKLSETRHRNQRIYKKYV